MSATRLKREECKRTKHDSIFSQWKILIGPNDWKNYSMGKDGTERYRIHNLPISCSCPGLYELGIASTLNDLGRDIGKLSHDRIIVVYLGQAENLRTRLQYYGRDGSHLDGDNSFGIPCNSDGFGFQKGPGLFRQIFSRGFPIVFRWTQVRTDLFPFEMISLCSKIDEVSIQKKRIVRGLLMDLIRMQIKKPDVVLVHVWMNVPSNEGGAVVSFAEEDEIKSLRKGSHWTMENKKEAEKAEALLLRTFDYAWNKGGNGVRRRNDVLLKLDEIVSNSISVDMIRRKFQQWMWDNSFGRKKVGIRIKSIHATETESTSSIDSENKDPRFRIFKLGRSRPSLVRNKSSISDAELVPVGSVPILNESISQNILITTRNGVLMMDQCDKSVVCGVVFDDGSVCMEEPVQGRKRCILHKGMRTNGSICKSRADCKLIICGARLGHGMTCMEMPVKGRKRCELHKGMKVKTTTIP
ncbi:hypothetical protein Scep_024650 [Stephania cephalantha]|uniref:Uncharacterized protein n=1 Tax=Stephania cephalantha TaxID=152367 RepID=A0AAP0HYN7_9MAGN